MPGVTVITPTCDQPTGLRLCEGYLARQTYRGEVQWIVVDDGVTPARLSRPCEYIWRPREPGCTGAQSLCRNLLAAVPLVRGAIVAIVEHDDYYAPTHLERLVAALVDEGRLIAGDDEQRYYHVGQRVWRVFQNRGASLCQTAFRVALLPLFEQVIRQALRRDSYGVDGAFWEQAPAHAKALAHATGTVVGIKGLPGRPGLGIGHRPTGPLWRADPDGATLRAWLGDDAAAYLEACSPERCA